jgi:hypothetical protein
MDIDYLLVIKKILIKIAETIANNVCTTVIIFIVKARCRLRVKITGSQLIAWVSNTIILFLMISMKVKKPN